MKKGLAVKGLCIGMACATILCAGRVLGETALGEEFQKKIESIVNRMETDAPKSIQIADEIKTAGASYMPELMAPINPDKYQAEGKQRLLAGVYLVDMEYAIIFEKKKEISEYGLALFSLLDKLGFPVPKLELQLRDVLTHLDDPDVEERFAAMAKSLEEDSSWKEMIATESGVRLIVEGLYGWMVEGIYISTEIAAQCNFGPAFLNPLNAQKSYLKTYMELLDQFVDKPELASTLRSPERIDVIKAVSALLSSPNAIGKEEVEGVRKIIGQARNQILR